MRKLLFSAVIFGLMAVTVSAQDAFKLGVKNEKSGGYARVMSMGGENGGQRFLIDPTNIAINPAFANVYDNFLFGDLGTSVAADNDGNGQFAAFNLRIKKGFSLGVLLARNDYAQMGISNLGMGKQAANQLNNKGGLPGTNAPDLDNNFTVFGAYQLNEKIHMGLAIAYASAANNRKPAAGTEAKGSTSQLGINAGLLAFLSNGRVLDLAAHFVTAGASSEGTTKDEVSYSEIAVDARYFQSLNSRLTFVPVVGFQTMSGTYKKAGTSTDLPSTMGLGIGLGLNYMANEDILLVGGVTLGYNSETTKSTATDPELSNTTLIFPAWNIGAEWYLIDWLKGRIGYASATWKRIVETKVTATTKDENSFNLFDRTGMTLGVGFKFGSFNLDMTVNDEIIRQGFNNIGGGKATFAHVSASYAL
ncbi:MAG: hypothetical protein L6Q59_08355 [Ignavibacteriaceae bacterium]|nr:hypothetical protein [Ignavibacteriaceae bacterium]